MRSLVAAVRASLISQDPAAAHFLDQATIKAIVEDCREEYPGATDPQLIEAAARIGQQVAAELGMAS